MFLCGLPGIEIPLCAGLRAQVDIYSTGVIMWELVTVQAPSRGNLRTLRVPEECPMDIAKLIQDCLEANNPSARPSATDIYDRIMARSGAAAPLTQHLGPC
jgi:hypothetical protein